MSLLPPSGRPDYIENICLKKEFDSEHACGRIERDIYFVYVWGIVYYVPICIYDYDVRGWFVNNYHADSEHIIYILGDDVNRCSRHVMNSIIRHESYTAYCANRITGKI